MGEKNEKTGSYTILQGVAIMGKKLGSRVCECRHRLGLTQSELGRAVGLTTSYISQIENGKKTNISRNNLEKLAEALGQSVESLVEGVKIEPAVKRPVLSREENAHLEIYRQLSPEDRRAVAKFIAWLISEEKKSTQ